MLALKGIKRITDEVEQGVNLQGAPSILPF